ncbi:hypothetical protein N5D10_15925 [Citrobacter freundii]|uniref:hypothetical protein n=1 Tax=Citrobacter freundii TaxID=546 RepID=UPI002449CFB5|nr:hypothetical protein [Citrobacter freundii]MDH0784704.1 hypothetical protein [Citrobacter freundii]HCL6004050.1 hypothetical protein [Citrobacter freundii]HED2398394.1 hypothetical protein [Citrobacter freundii]
MNLAAVWNDLLQGNFLHIWQGVIHAHWSNVWAGISAIMTTMAVITAIVAMRVWKSQEKLKAKQKFKAAISEYAWALAIAPNVSDRDKDRDDVENITRASDLFFNCRSAWLATEGLLEKNRKIMKHWNIIQNGHVQYLIGNIPAKKLLSSCKIILAEKFVFK